MIISKPNNDPRFKLTAFPKKQKLIKIKLLKRNDKRETEIGEKKSEEERITSKHKK